MISPLKKFSLLGVLTVGLIAVPTIASATIQCPSGWNKEMHGVAEVCVAQNQTQNQAQVQNNNQNQNVNQNVVAKGGSSSSSSSSDSSITINNPTPTPTPVTYVVTTPQVVYTAPTVVTTLPKTGLPETALALSGILPVAGFALKKYGFKKNAHSGENSANSIWTERKLKG